MSNAVTINGVSGYITSVSGTATSYIPAGFLSAAELSFIDGIYPNKAKGVASVAVTTAGSGYTNPVVSFSGGTGTVAATAYAVLDAAGGIGSIVVTNPGVYSVLPTGAAVTDATGSSAVLAAPVETTDLKEYLEADLWASNGQNAWSHFGGYVVIYDSASDDVLIAGSDIAHAAGSNPTQAEYDAAVDVLNAIKHVINKNLGTNIK
jgi:hypothetical protein